MIDVILHVCNAIFGQRYQDKFNSADLESFFKKIRLNALNGKWYYPSGKQYRPIASSSRNRCTSKRKLRENAILHGTARWRTSDLYECANICGKLTPHSQLQVREPLHQYASLEAIMHVL